MIKWCVVWRHSQHLSHPSLCSVSPSSANTHKFPFPEMCFENRSFILTVNNQADRYSLTILSNMKTLGEKLHRSCSSESQRWRVTNHHKHTHEECRITHVSRIWWYAAEQMLILLVWVVKRSDSLLKLIEITDILQQNEIKYKKSYWHKHNFNILPGLSGAISTFLYSLLQFILVVPNLKDQQMNIRKIRTF